MAAVQRICRCVFLVWLAWSVPACSPTGSDELDGRWVGDGMDVFGDLPGDLCGDLPAEVLQTDAGVLEDSADDVGDSTPLLDGIPGGISAESLVLDPSPDPEVTLPDGVGLRVVTFNIYGAQWGTPEQIGEVIAALDPDLLGLQECGESTAIAIAGAAGLGFVFGTSNPIASRYPLKDAEVVPLSGGRSYTRARIEKQGVVIAFYNVHLGWNLDGNRQFREFVEEHLNLETADRVVITGDFNDEHLSTQNTILETWGTDVFTAASIWPGERISWPSIGFDETEGSQLIDLVWFRRTFPAIVLSAGPVNLSPVLSDHKPVLAELLFPKDDEPFALDPLAELRDDFHDFPREDATPVNLLINPGAEEGLAGWDVAGGARVLLQQEHQTARSGSGMFAGFPQASVGQEWSSGTQVADLGALREPIAAGRGVLWVKGYLSTGFQVEEQGEEWSNIPKPMDDGELILELQSTKGDWRSCWHSGRLDPLQWLPVGTAIRLPVDTAAARLTWMSHHRSGNGPSNDAFFDDLSLRFGETSAGPVVLSQNLFRDVGARSGSDRTGVRFRQEESPG